MRRVALALLVVLSVATVGIGLWQLQQRRSLIEEQSKPGPYEIKGEPASDFTLQDLDGKRVSLSDYKGQVVLLNFWATWCPPCTAEMPDLNALHQEHNLPRGLVVIGVNQQETAVVVRPYVDQRSLVFPILLDTDGRVAVRRFAVRGLPMSFIIDREGVIRDAWAGRIEKEAMLARLERVW